MILGIRKINRNRVKQQLKKYNEGILKKNRASMRWFWSMFQEKRYGQGRHTSILIKNAPNKPGARKKVFEERRGN